MTRQPPFAGGEIHLIPDPVRPGAMAVRIGGTDQSFVDPGDPTLLEYDYVQRLADGIDTHAPAGQRLRVVHVGGAGMTLARYVAHTRPTSAQIVCEPDEELTELVRAHLPLPRNSGIKVRPVDGRAGLAAMRDAYADIVITDAFVGARVPAELTTLEWFTDVRRVLVADGLCLVNLTDRAPFDYARRVIAGLRAVFAEVAVGTEPATLKGRRFGNLVLFASAAPLPLPELTRRAASSAFPYRMVAGEALARLIGAARPFSGDDAAMSPPPPAGKTFFS